MDDFFDSILDEDIEISEPDIALPSNYRSFDSIDDYYKIQVNCNNFNSAIEHMNTNSILNYIDKRLRENGFTDNKSIIYKVDAFNRSRIGIFNEFNIIINVFGTFETFDDFYKFLNTVNILPKFENNNSIIDVFFKLLRKHKNSKDEEELEDFCIQFKYGAADTDRDYLKKESEHIYEFSKYFIDEKFDDLDELNPTFSILYKLSQPVEKNIWNNIHNIAMSFMNQIILNKDKMIAGYTFDTEYGDSKKILERFEFNDKSEKEGYEIISKYESKKVRPRGFMKLLESGCCGIFSNLLTAIALVPEEIRKPVIFIYDGLDKENENIYCQLFLDIIENRTKDLCSLHNKINIETKCTIAEDTHNEGKYMFGLYIGEIYDLDEHEQFDPIALLIYFYGTSSDIKNALDILYG